MLVRTAVNVWYRCVIVEDVEKPVAHIACCGPDSWRSTEHASDKIQDVGYCAEGVVIMLERGFLQKNYPRFDFVEIGMER